VNKSVTAITVILQKRNITDRQTVPVLNILPFKQRISIYEQLPSCTEPRPGVANHLSPVSK